MYDLDCTQNVLFYLFLFRALRLLYYICIVYINNIKTKQYIYTNVLFTYMYIYIHIN